MAKVCGPIADYVVRYDLLQFQFDRHILRTVLGSDVADAQTTVANRHRHWTPEYWRRQHAYLQDLTRQHGPPHVFVTIAPWEFDFRWPYWLQRLMATSTLGPTQLPAAEAIAVAHAVKEFCTSYLAVFGPHRQWTQNLFSHKHKKCNNVLAFMGRWEFQEGGPSHSYGKGRGSLHCHLLFWLKDFRASLLERFICAALPTDDAELAALALERQRSIPGTGSKAPVQEEASFWE